MNVVVATSTVWWPLTTLARFLGMDGHREWPS